jgi:uncharacterized protein
MARKRKRRRSFHATPFVLALLLLSAVAWAIIPRHHPSAPRHVLKGPPRAAVANATIAPSSEPALSTQNPSSIQSGASPAASPASNGTPAALSSEAQVAVIIDDCGQWLQTERGYLSLPIPITVSVLPHVHYTEQIAQEASNAGKGIMLHLPMEPLSHANPGAGEIRTGMTDEAIVKQTEDDLAQVPLAQGVNNHEGSEASADERVMKDVIRIAKEHDLFFIDSRTNSKTVAAQQAQDLGVPTASRDVFLDNKADVRYTESMLERTVAIAKRNGSAIAIGHPKPTTLEALRQMYPKMQAQGVRFVLASELAR